MINAQENSSESVYAVLVRWILTLWVIPARRFVWTIVDRCVDTVVNVSCSVGRELHVLPVLAVNPRRQRGTIRIRMPRPDRSEDGYTGGRSSGSSVRSRLG
jgi:hypothetical protein